MATRFEVKLPPPRDDKPLDDPEAWGFCDYCAFAVAVFDGLMDVHRRKRNGHDDSPCHGSGRPPLPEIPIEAEARQRVSLRKDPDRSTSRAYWQRTRSNARKVSLVKVNPRRYQKRRVVVETGPLKTVVIEGVDLSDAVSGVTINPPRPEGM